MIHNSISVLNSRVYLSYAIGCEYYDAFDKAAEFIVLDQLLDTMGVEAVNREGPKKGYLRCCVYVFDYFQLTGEYPNSGESSMDWFDWSFDLSIAEARILQDLAVHVARVLSQKNGFEEVGDGANASFSYQNNNTGRVFAWIHANDCSERFNNL
jgi:hypothetical protein